MKKVLNWVLNHLKIVLAILAFGVTAAIIAGTMIGSYVDFKAYEKKYNENELILRSESEPLAKRVEVNANYNSKLPNYIEGNVENLKVVTKMTYEETDYIPSLNTKIGNNEDPSSITLAFDLDAITYVDIQFVVRSAVKDEDENLLGVEDLLGKINFTINNYPITNEVDIEADDWQVINFIGVALPEGSHTIQVKPVQGKEEFMPDVQRIGVYSTAESSFTVTPVEEAE